MITLKHIYRNGAHFNNTSIKTCRTKVFNKIPERFIQPMIDHDVYIMFFDGLITDTPEFSHNKGIKARIGKKKYTWEDVYAAYHFDKKVIALKNNKADFYLLHELGHCFDDIIGRKYFGKSISKTISLKTVKSEPFYAREMEDANYFNINKREYVANAVDRYFRNKYSRKQLKKNNPTIFKILNSL